MNNKRKILVLGVDGLNPKTAKHYMNEGKMPNLKKLVERGSAREDLMLLGANPTITPPQWTTLSTGAYPMTHGITDFWRCSHDSLEYIRYNLDSRLLTAEQMWNVTSEAGIKTLVFHWPGCGWPPTSDNKNLYVVDGTSPGNIGNGTCEVDKEFVVAASVETKVLKVQAGSENADKIPCVVDVKDNEYVEKAGEKAADAAKTGGMKCILVDDTDGMPGTTGNMFYRLLHSPIKDASGWESAPIDAKEFTILMFNGMVRRVALVLKNEAGIYDRVAIYKSKKDIEPLVVLEKDVFTVNCLDTVILDGNVMNISRNMRVLDLEEDGSRVRMWISAAMLTDRDNEWHPKRIHREMIEKFGPIPPTSIIGASLEDHHIKCQTANWAYCAEWQSNVINALIDQEGIEMVFSHFHNVDMQQHTFLRYLGRGNKVAPAELFSKLNEETYKVTDEYIGKFLYRLDEGWTIFLVSDHGLVSPIEHGVFLGDNCGVNVAIMRELGFTELLKDENGNDILEIDWEHTKAVAMCSCHIYINLKGRNTHTLADGRIIDGIVDPADKYQLEEEIMTALYGYKDPKTGQRVVSLALRNKDAVLIGMGGPESGDIVYFTAEGYNWDHGDGLSTFDGLENSSLSPIFVAAGTGIKEGYTTTRVVRQVDLVPTIATLLGTRVPEQCEGAPVYQILV